MSENTHKVLCPYCGAEMEECEMADLLGFVSPAICDLVVDRCTTTYMYNCPECWACTPMAKTLKEAYATALRRPMQKPLTLEDLQSLQEGSIVWLEARNPDDVLWDDGWGMPYFYSETKGMNPRHFFYRIGTDVLDIALRSEYGKTWLCWATKPTEEERKAAKWEADHED